MRLRGALVVTSAAMIGLTTPAAAPERENRRGRECAERGRIRLAADGISGTLDRVVTSTKFQTPATAAKPGCRLGVVNGESDTGFPPTADTYEVVVVNS